MADLDILDKLDKTLKEIKKNNIESNKEAKKDRRLGIAMSIVGFALSFIIPILLWWFFRIG